MRLVRRNRNFRIRDLWTLAHMGIPVEPVLIALLLQIRTGENYPDIWIDAVFEGRFKPYPGYT